MDHDRSTRSAGEGRLEGGGVGHPRGQQGVGVQLRLVDRVGVDTDEVEPLADHVRAERAATHLLSRRSDRDQPARVRFSKSGHQRFGPRSSVVVRRVGKQPHRRLVGQIPGDDVRNVSPPPGEHACLVHLQAAHLRVTVGVAAAAPRHVPERIPHLAADEQCGVDRAARAAGRHPPRRRAGPGGPRHTRLAEVRWPARGDRCAPHRARRRPSLGRHARMTQGRPSRASRGPRRGRSAHPPAGSPDRFAASSGIPERLARG